MTDEIHLNDEDLAAYVDGGLDRAARARAEAHLLTCDDCRDLVAGAGRLLPAPARWVRRTLWLGSGLAAAAVLVLLLTPTAPVPAPTAQTRDVETVGPAGLSFSADAPVADLPVRLDTLVFRWTGLGPGATYQVTLSDSAGGIVWRERTEQSSLALPASAATRLAPGHAYYWRVDALLPDLRSATTGPRRLVPLAP